MFDRILGLVGPAVAFAGHSSAEDPALVGGPVIESLVDPVTIDLGTTTVHEPSYCEGFTNWGGGASVETIASGAAAPTLTLSGWWIDGTGAHQEIEISSTLNWGTRSNLIDATSTLVYAEITSQPTTISINRQVASAFDGIDLTTATIDEIARSFLRSLAATTEFVVTSGAIHDS